MRGEVKGWSEKGAQPEEADNGSVYHSTVANQHHILPLVLMSDSVQGHGNAQYELSPILSAWSDGAEWLAHRVGKAVLLYVLVPVHFARVAGAYLLEVIVKLHLQPKRGRDNPSSLAGA